MCKNHFDAHPSYMYHGIKPNLHRLSIPFFEYYFQHIFTLTLSPPPPTAPPTYDITNMDAVAQGPHKVSSWCLGCSRFCAGCVGSAQRPAQGPAEGFLKRFSAFSGAPYAAEKRAQKRCCILTKKNFFFGGGESLPLY